MWKEPEEEGNEEGQEEEEVTLVAGLLSFRRVVTWLQRRKHPRRPERHPKRRVTTEARKSAPASHGDLTNAGMASFDVLGSNPNKSLISLILMHFLDTIALRE